MIARGIAGPSAARIPPSYRLGAGHMTFFCDKLGYLLRRQASLVAEMRRRGYKPAFDDPQCLLDGIPEAWRGDWEPDSEAFRINRARIAERTPKREQGIGP